MVNRGGRICLAAFPQDPVPVDLAYLVRNNIYVFGIRGEGQSATHRAMALMKQKRFDARLIHTHTFPLDELPTALKYARERIEDAIKGYTLGAAFAGRREKTEGSIEVGKVADLIILSQDLFKIEPNEISNTEVMLTMAGGKVVYTSPKWAGTGAAKEGQ